MSDNINDDNVLIPEVLATDSVETTNTYAQWNRTRYVIDIELPKPESDHYSLKSGSLHQEVEIGNRMETTTLTILDERKMVPKEYMVGMGVKRPSGIYWASRIGDELDIASDVLTSDDRLIMPLPDDKILVTVNTPNNTHVTFTGPTRVELPNEPNKCLFAYAMHCYVAANDGYDFKNLNIEDVIITPDYIKDCLKINLVDNYQNISIGCEFSSESQIALWGDFEISCPEPQRSGYTVTINLPEGIERESGGELVQNVVIGQEITQVNLRSIDNDRYKWNDTVQTFTQDGITFNIDTSQTPIVTAWISGTPLRSVTIDVPAPDAYHKLTVNYGTGLTDWSGYMYDTTPAFAPVIKWVKRGTSTNGSIYRVTAKFIFIEGENLQNDSSNGYENDPHYIEYTDSIIVNPSNMRDQINIHVEVPSYSLTEPRFTYEIPSMSGDIEITLPALKLNNPTDVIFKCNLLDISHIKHTSEYCEEDGIADRGLMFWWSRGDNTNTYSSIEIYAEEGYHFGPGWTWSKTPCAASFYTNIKQSDGTMIYLRFSRAANLDDYPDGVTEFFINGPVPIGSIFQDMYIKFVPDRNGVSNIKIPFIINNPTDIYVNLHTNACVIQHYNHVEAVKTELISRLLKNNSNTSLTIHDIAFDSGSDYELQPEGTPYKTSLKLTLIPTSVNDLTPIYLNDITKYGDASLDSRSGIVLEPSDEFYTINVTLGKNLSTYKNAKLNQVVLDGKSMIGLTVDIERGYSVGSYIGGVFDGINVKVIASSNYIVISGSPSKPEKKGTINIVLPDAVKLVNLTVNLPADGSVKVKDGEESRLSQSIEAGEYINGITLVPKDANYKMTQAWRQTITVEPANEHITMMTSDTETYISGRISENTVITVPALSLAFSPNIKQGALLIVAPLTGTPVGNDGMSVRIKAPKILNGTYGDFTFNNSDTASCGSTYGDRFVLYDVPPGEYTATFTYEMSFDTKFTLTGDNSVIIDDAASSITETSMIYVLDGLAFGGRGNEDLDITTGDTAGRIGFSPTTIVTRPDFPNESEVAIAQTFVNDLRAIFDLNEENLKLEYNISLDMGHIDMLYYGGVFAGTSFVIIDVLGSKRYRIATFVPYG